MLFFLLALSLLTTGCKTQLYSGLGEDEVNEMMSLLLQQGIACEKAPGQEQTFALMVDEKMVASSLALLQDYGYPRPKFKTMGEIFKREGMVSSPMEERVRFIYALSQEIAQTITQIDGVVAARVHIVLPENNPLNEKTLPSAASIFIKHRPDADLALLTPRIKALVAHSIEGLTYDRVAVVLVESQMFGSSTRERPLSPPSRMPPWLPAATGGAALLIGLGLGGGIAFFVLKKRPPRHTSDASLPSQP